MKIRYFLPILIAVSLAFLSLMPTPKVSALSGSQFQAGSIIDDSIFFNPAAIDSATIQRFLNSKVPICDTYHSSSNPNYQPPFTCLKDFRQDTPTKPYEAGLCNAYGGGNKQAAEIIYDIAQICGINPAVLIVLLEKEQSLITDTWPWSIQYRSATGYGCPDTAPCDAEYYGFFNQVYAAARQFKRYVKDSHLFNYRSGFTNYIQYNPNAGCGGTNIGLETRATAALYNYTPYQPNAAALNNLYGSGDSCSAYGNRNFWRLFNDWFGPTRGTALIKGSGPTIYVVGSDPNIAYGVASGDVLRAYGLESTPITGVSDSYIASLDTSKMLTTLFMQPNDGTIFLADSGRKIGISSGTYCTAWNLPCGQASAVASLPYAVTSPMATQPPLSYIMQSNGVNFLMENGRRRPFPDGTRLDATSWATTPVTVANSPLNSSQVTSIPAMPDNRFFKVFGNGSIYFCAASCNSLGITPTYYTFSSFDNFKAWWNNSTVLGDRLSSFNSAAPSAIMLNNFVTDGSSTYLLNGSNRIRLTLSPPVTPISTVTRPDLAQITQKQLITIDDSKAFQLPGGAISTIRSDVLRPIPTMSDLFLSFSDTNIIPVSSSLADVYPIGKLFVVPGRVYKPSDSSAMYMYGSDGYLWALGNLGELNSALTWVNNVIVAPFSVMQSNGIKIYAAMVQMNGNYYAVQYDGSLRQLPANVMSSQRNNFAMQLTGPVASRPAIDNRTAGFIRFDNGTIFKIDPTSNNIKPIGSMATYSALGGTPANTTQVSVKANDAFNIGSPL